MPLSAQQIIAYALQIAKAPGFTQQAGDFLNAHLRSLALDYDFDINRATTIISISSGYAGTPVWYPLPASYLRAREVFYNVSGTVYTLNQIPLEEFDMLFTGQGVSNFPAQFATDISQTPAVMAFYPPSSISTDVTVRHYSLPTDITNPSASTVVPWFPDQRYLITALAADIMQLTDDDRYDKTLNSADEMLRRYQRMDNDDEGYAKTVSLDRRRFRSTANLKPTKTTGF